MTSNFDFMSKTWPELTLLGKLAEMYFFTDKTKCMKRLAMLAEHAVCQAALLEKADVPKEISVTEKIRILNSACILPDRIRNVLGSLANPENDISSAGEFLRIAYYLCCWLYTVYANHGFGYPEYCAAFDISANPDFDEIVKREEMRTEFTAEITVAAPEADKNARRERAQRAAKQLPLSLEEAALLGETAVTIKTDALSAINYAMQQNRMPIVEKIEIENLLGKAIENVNLEISSVPAFIMPFKLHIERLPANKAITVSRPKLILNGEFFAGMTEKISGVFQIELTSDKRKLLCENVETSLLAFDEWHGDSTYPELLAAFVTPNHPELAKILARASEFLGEWTGSTSLNGYSSRDANRVLSQAAAIFTAVKELAITYVLLPASFESRGQRVRLCDMVMKQKMGNCMDLTLMYAACLEAAGLNPLLIVAKGHIFAGVWLEEKLFPEIVQDDFSLITKRLASGINEIAVVETTAVTTGADRSFDDARRLAEQQLNSEDMRFFIDVTRARKSRIYPLPLRILSDDGWEVHHAVRFDEENMTAPERLDETVYIAPDLQDDRLPKLIQWERKLLDLGMRNSLINLHITKSQLPILISSPDHLENALSTNGDFTILPRPADLEFDKFSFEALYEKGLSAVIRAEFENKRLRSVLDESELSAVIKSLYRTAKVSLEENGANMLYLALGVLRWYETKESTRPCYAPIVLIPIEMVRRSAAQGYVIRLREEEPQMNITLLEKLKQDFEIDIKGLDPLPADECGVDIRRVFTIIRQAVMYQPRWDVLETACIGIFSFSQFVMWNDIRNRSEDLMRNKVVKSLIDGKLCWKAEPLEIGDRVNESDVLLPMPADASQLYAIQAACRGESFVLHGPPGTGKSQTITSLIANALAKGKRVLFVAEKMAALAVVQKRLENIGIGPFCLELHSNKSKKRDVLEQLRRATEVTRARTNEEYAAKAEMLAKARAELDGYVRQLHKTLSCGSNLYSLINEYEAVKNAPEIAPFERSFLKELDPRAMSGQMLLLERMAAAAREAGVHPLKHPLRSVACSRYSQSLRMTAPQVIGAYLECLSKMRASVLLLTEALGEEQPASFQELQRLCRKATHMTCWYDVPSAWAKTEFPQKYFEEIIKMARHFARAGLLESKLLIKFREDFLMQDGEALCAEFARASEKWLLLKSLSVRKLVKTVNSFAKTPVEKEDAFASVTALREYAAEKRAGEALFEKYGPELEGLYKGEDTDWESVISLSEQALGSAQALYDINKTYRFMNRYAGKEELRKAVFALADGMEGFEKAKTAFDECFKIEPKAEENWLDGQILLCEGIYANTDQLKEWIAYTGAAAEVRRIGLGNVVRGYENGMSQGDICTAYRKALLQGLIACAIDDSDVLNEFSGAVFNEKIEQYKRMDREWASLSQQEIYCRLASKVPNFTKEAAESSEIGILQRAIRSGGRGISIRRLFEQIPNLLSYLCPCMLMSPLSAAQYLDSKRELFDIVVFDEASQMSTCKAVGVLARGKNAVIVGDPKQMPPTAFFAASTVDEDCPETEDLESILDDCLALNMPQSHLLWHYRSRHESLIAFSNSQFYENRLFTFPSVNDRESRVRLVHVEGVFERGKSRTNRQEAKAVVEEIKRRFKSPELCGQSIGIVTFNTSQQNLIDDLLNDACSRDPELEKWAYNDEEPIFIKNLENVQGDERDVILFSIGFGPDSRGKISMNFGPLNREGGWRRLNVAVSRARCEMVVFSALEAHQLDMNRTNAEGVYALKRFLEYAQGKTLALDEAALDATTQHSGIADSICRALAENGYRTDLSVGRSKYRMDIGVIHPEDSERYILGIMLDGATYCGAKTTRDREIAQTGVLSGLGWRVLRVWCMDWWDNSAKEIRRILDTLDEIRKAGEEAVQKPEPSGEEREKPDKGGDAELLAAPAPEPVREAPVYEAATLSQSLLTAEEFTEEKYVSEIHEKLKAVIGKEAPISRPLLTRRVVQSFGINRAGARMQAHLNAILDKMLLPCTIDEDTVFYWRQDQKPNSYTGLRVNGEENNRREITDIPRREAANAICVVLDEQISMDYEDLLREAAEKLGFARAGNRVLTLMAITVRFAQEKGWIVKNANGNFVLSESGKENAQAVLKSF